MLVAQWEAEQARVAERGVLSFALCGCLSRSASSLFCLFSAHNPSLFCAPVLRGNEADEGRVSPLLFGLVPECTFVARLPLCGFRDVSRVLGCRSKLKRNLAKFRASARATGVVSLNEASPLLRKLFLFSLALATGVPEAGVLPCQSAHMVELCLQSEFRRIRTIGKRKGALFVLDQLFPDAGTHTSAPFCRHCARKNGTDELTLRCWQSTRRKSPMRRPTALLPTRCVDRVLMLSTKLCAFVMRAECAPYALGGAQAPKADDSDEEDEEDNHEALQFTMKDLAAKLYFKAKALPPSEFWQRFHLVSQLRRGSIPACEHRCSRCFCLLDSLGCGGIQGIRLAGQSA